MHTEDAWGSTLDGHWEGPDLQRKVNLCSLLICQFGLPHWTGMMMHSGAHGWGSAQVSLNAKPFQISQ